MQVEGLRVRLDNTHDGLETAYGALSSGEVLSVPVLGVEQDDVLGECLVVEAPGQLKGLVPKDEVGQIPWRFLSDLMGQEVLCRVVSVDRSRGVVICSRKAVQEWQAERTWATLQRYEEPLRSAREQVVALRAACAAAKRAGRDPYMQAVDAVREAEAHWRSLGPVFDAVVRRVWERQAVVDIGGVLATLPRSETAHGPIMDCRAVLKPGYGFQVRALLVNSGSGTVVVSRRALLPDPWQEVAQRYKEGGIYLGTVALIRQEDVIVELQPGVAVRVDRYTLGPATGARVRVLVRRIRPDRRIMFGRILSVVEEDEDPATAARG